MKKLNKGFTIIELLIVVAMTSVLATAMTPKIFKEIRKATVATVQHNLGVIRSRLSLDETLSEKFPDLASKDGKDKADLLKTYSIESTPAFADDDGVNHTASSKVVTPRDNTGGWFYMRDTGEFYANLPDGAYTGDKEYEIWNGESSGGEEVTKPSDPVGGDWDNFITGAIKNGTSPYGEITFNQGNNGLTITPKEWSQNNWEKVYLYDENHNLILNSNSEDGSYSYQEVIDVEKYGSNNTTNYIAILEKTDPDTGEKIHLYSDPK